MEAMKNANKKTLSNMCIFDSGRAFPKYGIKMEVP
jgi:hypothetical protein